MFGQRFLCIKCPPAQNKIKTYEGKTEELQEVLNFKQDELEKKKVIIRRLDMELVKVQFSQAGANVGQVQVFCCWVSATVHNVACASLPCVRLLLGRLTRLLRTCV